MNAPKFEAGKIYHLSHNGGMPTNIYIDMVYMKPNSKEWMYRITSEANGCRPTYVSESLILDRVTLRKSKVYKNEFVTKMIKSGFRFAGNINDIKSATDYGKELAKNPNIHDVMIYNALDSDGNETNGYGIWIRWDIIIDENHNDDTIPIRIK